MSRTISGRASWLRLSLFVGQLTQVTFSNSHRRFLIMLLIGIILELIESEPESFVQGKVVLELIATMIEPKFVLECA